MSGSELARAKEVAAQKMREKQAAGKNERPLIPSSISRQNADFGCHEKTADAKKAAEAAAGKK